MCIRGLPSEIFFKSVTLIENKLTNIDLENVRNIQFVFSSDNSCSSE